MERVSVTRLKGNLAHYLTELKAGHSFVITDREVAVAVVEPLAWKPDGDEAMNRLVRQGQVTPPSQELPDEFFTSHRTKDPEGVFRRFLSEDKE